jgi:hypothetical protein
MGFPFWLRNWCEKEISWYAKYIDCRLHASVYRWLFIIEWFNNVLFNLGGVDVERKISDCKLVNATMIFNGNFIANWNSSESGQISWYRISLILWNLKSFWYAPNYILDHRLSDCFISISNRNKRKCIDLVCFSQKKNCNWN